jgi:hypothetical protein
VAYFFGHLKNPPAVLALPQFVPSDLAVILLKAFSPDIWLAVFPIDPFDG